MNRTGKRLIGIILALTMILTLFPTAAFATGEDLQQTQTMNLQYGDYVPLSEFGAASIDAISIGAESSGILKTEEVGGQSYIHAIGVGLETITVGSGDNTQTYSVTVEPAKLNVVLVSGQSNAEGTHGSPDVSPITPDLGTGYIWNSDALTDLSIYVATLDTSKSVGWYPALAAEWYALTGEKTVVIHMCSSGSPISVWADYDTGAVTTYTQSIASSVQSCITAIQNNTGYEIVRTGYYWLQGETDAYLIKEEGITEYTTAARYTTAYTAMHNAFVNALTVTGAEEPYGAILSCRTRHDIGNFKAIEYCGMRVAQQYLANNHSDIYMASVITDGWYENKTVNFTAASGEFSALTYSTGAMGANNIHYNQSGYNVLGLDAADNMYAALVGNSSIRDIELIGQDGYTKYSENAQIIAEDNRRIVGDLNTSDDGKAQIVARPVPISATCSSVTMTLQDSAGNPVNGVMDEYGLINLVALKTEVESNGKAGLTLTVEAGSVSKTYTLTCEDYAADDPNDPGTDGNSFHYLWDFTADSSYGTDSDGNVTVTSVFDENTLTYTSDTAAHGKDGLVNTNSNWFTMNESITLKRDQEWIIEWSGSMDNPSNGVLISDNTTESGSRTTPYVYLKNGQDGEAGAKQYGASLRPQGTSGGPTYNFANNGTGQNFNLPLLWKFYNDGKGTLTLSNSDNYLEVVNYAADAPESYTFNALLGYYLTTNRLCYKGTIEYVEIYTPDREEEVALVGIEVTSQPDQIIYEVGDSFDADGMVITAIYSNNTTKEVTNYTVTPEPLTEGTTEVIISYSENGKTVTTTQAVSVGNQTTETTGKSYYWDFSNASDGTLAAESGDGWNQNTLTYTGTTMPTVENGTFTNESDGYFITTTPITLSEDKAWTIEWKGNTTDQSILLANNSEGESQNAEKKEYVYIHSENNNSVSLRSGGTSGNISLSNIPAEVKSDPNVVWRISHDGNGNITISCSGTDAANAITPYTGTINQNYTFNGVLGRFMASGSMLCYTGQISYLKVWEEVVPDHLEIAVEEGVNLGFGETLERDDITVKVVYNDGTEVETSDYEISSVSYDGGNATFTLRAVMDGQIISGRKSVSADTTGYYWNFTGSVTNNNQIETSDNTQHNTLTYSNNSLTLSSEGFTNERGGFFTMETPITLLEDAPWTIEWQGSTSDQSVLLAKNSDEDTTSPTKTGPYVYIYNDMDIELGNSVSLRKQNTTAAATFSGLADAAREDANAIWYLIHNGAGNLTLACSSDGLTTVTTLEDVIDQNYTFNAVLGYFTENNRLCYDGTIKYLKIYPTAATVTGTTGELSVDATNIEKTSYNVGEEPDLTGMKVYFTFTPSDGSQQEKEITNYTYTTSPALITSDTEQITVTVNAVNTTANAEFGIKVTTNSPADYFHWAAVSADGPLASQSDATENALTPHADSRYYTMARPVSLEPTNHWRIEWTGSVDADTSSVLLSANTKANAFTTMRSTPYIYIRNGSDEGQYDISIIPSGMVGNYDARFTLDENQRSALSDESTTWILEYNERKLSLRNNKGYSESQTVALGSLLFNGIRGYFTVGTPLYYKGTLTDLKIYEQYEEDGYRWDFNGSSTVSGKTLNAAKGDIDLTYTDTSIPSTSNGLANTRPNYFTMADSKTVTLPVGSPWTIEWQGTTTQNSVLLANNSASDTSSPDKAGAYIYIYNDTGRANGDRIAFRTGDTDAIATFAIPEGLREDTNVTWYLVHDGSENLTLGWKGRDGLYYTSTVKGAVKGDYTFNSVLGYFTSDNMLCYTGTIQYLEISMEAKSLTNGTGTLALDTSKIGTDYQTGDVLALDQLGVTYTTGTTTYTVTDYQVSVDPSFLTPGTTSVTITVTALGETETVTIDNITVAGRVPQYYHWSGTLDALTAQTDGTSNVLTDQAGYYDMATPVYLDPDNHWRIEWTGSVTNGRNAILLSENIDLSGRTTPYIYVRNGGDNGEYDISLVYRGTATGSDSNANLIRFNLDAAAKDALSNPGTTWTLDYQSGKLSLYYNGTLVETKTATVQELAFNGIGGYFNNMNSMVYSGTLTDVKVYEALYDVTVGSTSNGSVTATPADAVYPGATVTLTNSPASGYQLDSYTVTDSSGSAVTVSGNTFMMPQSDVRVTATFSRNSGGNPGSSGGSSTTTYPITVDAGRHGDVTVRPTRAERGETVTITVEPDTGYELDELIVTDSSGDEISVRSKGDNKYTFTMPRSRVTIEATFVAVEDSGLPFIDVAANAWYYDAVAYAYENGLMSGTASNLFSPNATTTRGMIVTMLYRLEGEPRVSGTSTFDDVADGVYYTDAVIWANANGIVAGYDDTTFGPNDAITREQMAAILYRYAQYKAYRTTASADLSGYVDADAVSAYALPALQWASAEGLVTGTSSNTLTPDGSATRAQVATIFMRFMEDVAE